jgi:hypothetical protein
MSGYFHAFTNLVEGKDPAIRTGQEAGVPRSSSG